MNLRALSIRQPWAWLIVNGFKPVENRDWFTHVRGRFLIHAGATMTLDDYEACRIFIGAISSIELPPPGELQRGGIVGESVLVDCVSDMHGEGAEWFVGEFGLILKNSKPLPFQACKGLQRWFYVDYVQPLDVHADGATSLTMARLAALQRPGGLVAPAASSANSCETKSSSHAIIVASESKRIRCDVCDELWEESFFCETCSKLATDERLGDEEWAGPMDVCGNCCTCHLRGRPAPKTNNGATEVLF